MPSKLPKERMSASTLAMANQAQATTPTALRRIKAVMNISALTG